MPESYPCLPAPAVYTRHYPRIIPLLDSGSKVPKTQSGMTGEAETEAEAKGGETEAREKV